MKVEIEVISNRIVKPSSSTSDIVQSYKLSFLDQIVPSTFMPLVLFFPADNNLSNAERSNQLKKSLSQALVLFYPLAGRLVGNSHIICNDEGVPYLEARANCRLSDVLNDPIPGEMNKFLPYEINDVSSISLAVQVSFFMCGGMAVGVEMSHKIADACSTSIFLTSWAATSRGETDIKSPIREPAALFPPHDLAGYKPTWKQDDRVTKRFVFTAPNIALLREKYATHENYRRPTRFEALSTFILTRFIAVTQSKGDPSKTIFLVLAVNLRSRIDPPLPESYFGNVSRGAVASLSSGNNGDESCILKKIRDSICDVGGDYATEVQQEKHLNSLKDLKVKCTNGEASSFTFTNLCRFPFYEVDFGWGKPIWVGSAHLTFKNFVTLMATQSGDGIEAWVCFQKDDMAKFEADKEFLSFVC